MTQLTPSQLQILRRRPQTTQLYLSFYQPKTVFQAVVTGTYNQGDVQISFSGITTGSWWNMYPNMTIRLGSTQGGNEYGDLRLRSASGTYIDFAENEIIWTQGMYLTAIDVVDIQAIYPRIIQDPNNQTNVIFYKDLNIAYTNQNTIYGTFPCAGPHRAGFIVTGAYSTYWSSTGTYNVKGDSLTYSWAFEGGTPTGSTAKDPGFVRYTTPGQYKTRFIVTSSSGAVDTTYRYVSVYQKPSQGTNNPIEAWELSELSGSRGEGGYTARIKIMSIMPELQPHTLVVIWAEDTYGGFPVSLGGNSQNNESIVFNGYVLEDSIRFNYKESTMEFSIGSPSEIMKESEGFSVSCESKASATTWYELTEMTIQKALYHYLRWHSTFLNVNDFQYTGDDRYLQYFDSDRESLYDAIDNFVRNGLLGAAVCDRQGKLWAEISHYGLTDPFTDIPTNPLSPNKQDWMGDPTIQERRDSDTSFVELGGIAYYGTATNTFSALISNAPGITPLYHGKAERQEGLILLSQFQLNRIATNYLAYKNSPFPDVNLPINGNYRNIDIAPQEKFYLVIAPSDTIRNISLQDKPYTPVSMTWSYRSDKQTFIPELVLEQMATGTMAETVLIPVTPPYTQSGFDYPALQLPTFPVFNPPDAVGPSAPTRVLLHDLTAGIIYTSDFDAPLPTYITVNAGLTAAQYQGINWMGVCPNGAFYVASVPPAGDGFLARADYIGGVFTVLYSGGGVNTIWGVGIDLTSTERIGFIRGISGANKFYVGANGTWSAGLNINDGNIRADGISFGGTDTSWILTAFNQAIKVNSAGTSATSTTPSIIPNHIRAGTLGTIYTNQNGVTNLRQTLDNFTTILTINTTDSPVVGVAQISNYMSCDPTGQYIMTRALAGGRGKSTDFGYTFTPIPALPVGNYWFAYGGGTSRFIAAGGSVVRYTSDFGVSWLNKESNSLIGINPIPNLNMVKFVG